MDYAYRRKTLILQSACSTVQELQGELMDSALHRGALEKALVAEQVSA